MGGQVMQFPFAVGLDEGSDPKSQPPGTLEAGINLRWDKARRLAKRFGTEKLPSDVLNSASTVDEASRLITRGDELAVVCGTKIYAWSPSKEKWIDKGPIPDVGLTWPQTLVDSTVGAMATDAVVYGQYVVHAWVTGDPTAGTPPQTSGKIWVQVIDRDDGTIVIPPTLLSSVANQVRIVVRGIYAFIVWHDATNTRLRACALDMTTLQFGTNQLLRTDTAAASGFDACEIGSTIVIAYEKASGGLWLYSWSNSGTSLSATGSGSNISSETGSDIYCISIAGLSGERVWVAYYVDSVTISAVATSAVRYACVNASSLIQTVAPITIEQDCTACQVSVERVDSSNALVAWTIVADSSDLGPRTSTVKVSTTEPDDGSLRTSWQTRLASRLKLIDSRWFAFVTDYPDQSAEAIPVLGSYLIEADTSDSGATVTFPIEHDIGDPTIYDSTPHLYRGKVDHDIAGVPQLGCLPAMAVVTANAHYVCPLFFQASAAESNTNWRCGVRLVDVRLGSALPTDMWRGATIGEETYLAGGLLVAWDGRAAFDYGMRAPLVRSITPATTGGSMLAGTYSFQVLPTFRSGAGVLHRGPVSAAASGTVANTSAAKFTLAIATHSLDCKQYFEGSASPRDGYGPAASRQVLFETYRTVANGTNPQKLTAEPKYSVLLNDPQDAEQTLVATAPDSDVFGGSEPDGLALASRPTIYTVGDELEEVQPIASTTLALHQNRLLLVTGGGREVWFSKGFAENPGIAPGFFPTQRMLFEDTVTALASLDEKLVVFSADQIWIVLGDGPNIQGQDNRFTPPRGIQSDVGCVNPRSVVSGPDGVYFESARGLYLLTRGLELVWIGQGVRDTLASYPTITSAVLVAAQNEIRFTADSGEESVVLVWDYVRKGWLTRFYTRVVDAATETCRIADAVMHDGVWTFVTPDGSVYLEDESTCLDEGTGYVDTTAEIAWMSPSGPLSWHRISDVQVLGTSVANHRLSISAAFDYATSFAQTKTFDAGSDVTEVGPLEKAKIDLKVQKVQALKIRITDTVPANTTTHPVGTGAGVLLEGLGFLVKPKRGLAKTSSGRKG